VNSTGHDGSLLACGFGLRVVKLDHTIGAQTVVASNIGGEFSVHLMF